MAGINVFLGKEPPRARVERYKRYLYENSELKGKFYIDECKLIHIIPYVISMDNSLENYELLKKSEFNIKRSKDLKISNKMIKMGYIDKVTNYCVELNYDLEDVKKKYLELKNEEF